MKAIRFQSLFILAVACLLFILHVIGLNQPFLGNFAQHQTDYATVVQRWLETGIHPLNPVMRFIALGQNRLFYGDFPLNISLVALLCKRTGLSIELVGRGLSAFFFFISLWPLYTGAKAIFKDRAAALWILFFYASSPLVLIYGQSFLLEMTAFALAIFGYRFFFIWFEEGKKSALMIAAVFFAFMLAARIYFAPLLGPLGFLVLGRFKFGALRKYELYLFILITLFVCLAWQLAASHLASLQGDQSSLNDNMRVFMFEDPIFKMNKNDPRYYLALFDNSFIKIVTPVGIVLGLLGLGCQDPNHRKAAFMFGLTVMSFLPLFIVAPRKFIEFEYYFLPLVLIMAVLAGLMANKIVASDWVGKRISLGVIAGLTILFSLRHSVAPILVVPEEDRPVLAAAEKVREIVPQGSRVLASHNTSTSFLYYTDRDGWHFYLKDRKFPPVRNAKDHEGTAMDRLERYRAQGAEYFALANKSYLDWNLPFFDYLNQNYPLVYESADSLIYSLKERKEGGQPALFEA